MLKDIIFLLLWFLGLAYIVFGYLIENGFISFDRYYQRKARKKIEKDVFKYQKTSKI